MEKNELNLMLSVVKKYYELGMNQDQIAKEEFISKSSVCRLIKKAVQNGYVQFQIKYPKESVAALEHELYEQFGLDKVFITPSYTEDPDISRRDTCRAVAQDLCKIVSSDDIISVTWGNTMDVLAGVMTHEVDTNKSCSKIVMMNGSMAGDISSTKSSRIVEQFAEFFDAEGFVLPAPLIVDSKETADLIKNDSHIKYVLDYARESQIAVFSIGVVGEQSVLRRRGAYSKREYDIIMENQAVGDIIGHFFNIEGKRVSGRLDESMIGLDLDSLKEKKVRIGIAVGEEKASAIIGALRGGIINRLYTDERAAQKIVKLLKEQGLSKKG
ncbi:sugar-binding transcriptional regulator [Christensenellaceae bacterium OttesenSCG-928-K19]|nr:sugar-binding transcriptional regulator [Christensenellaceae bacterium OttesenSCG-928-K19]